MVILVALQDELEAVREAGRDLVLAAAWIGEMGERAATSRGQQLVQELNPTRLAMCGICAGWRKKLSLGDVVVADRHYSYDHGKIVVATVGEEELFHDIETFSLEKTWKMDAAFLSRAIPLEALAAERPSSREAQRVWLVKGHELRVLSGPTVPVRSVAFSPDGLSLASGSFDGTIRLWDVASGRCLAVLLSTAEGWVSCIPEAHPDGPRRGAFKMGGDIAGSFWHMIGLARFEPGELDELLPEGQKLRLPDDYLFLPPAQPGSSHPITSR